jgi:hypothetical protein
LLAALVALASGAGCSENRTVPAHDDYVAPPVEPLACFPNLDGQIDASELQTAYGTTVRYLVSPYGVERPIDVEGVLLDGVPTWDWSIDYADDRLATVVPETLADKWYAERFPDGQAVTPFDAAGTIDSVLRQDAEGIWLLGVASRVEDPPEGQTLLVYQSPVSVLRFPVRPGTTFVSTGEVHDGWVRGLQYAGRDVYEVTIDATGRVVLPQVEFTQAHRVRTRVTVEPAVGASVSRRQVSFFSECFAEVARASSRADEPLDSFTTAAEVWRLGLL